MLASTSMLMPLRCLPAGSSPDWWASRMAFSRSQSCSAAGSGPPGAGLPVDGRGRVVAGALGGGHGCSGKGPVPAGARQVACPHQQG